MSELLIVGGDSNSDPTLSTYKENNIMIWPEIIAAENSWDLINVSRSGSSNESIENSVYDAVLKHSKKNPIVMVLWSASGRLNLWDIDNFVFTSNKKRYTEWNNVKERYQEQIDEHKFIKHFSDLDKFSYEEWIQYRGYLNNQENEDNIDEFLKLQYIIEDIIKKYLKHLCCTDVENEIYSQYDKKIIDSSLRSFKRLKDILDSKDIRNTFKYSLSLVGRHTTMYPWWKDDIKNLSLIEKTKLLNRHSKNLQHAKYSKENSIIKELGMTWAEIREGFCSPKNKEYLLKCGHPNQKGHDKLAELFMESYNE